jgi:hypothetical protein
VRTAGAFLMGLGEGLRPRELAIDHQAFPRAGTKASGVLAPRLATQVGGASTDRTNPAFHPPAGNRTNPLLLPRGGPTLTMDA